MSIFYKTLCSTWLSDASSFSCVVFTVYLVWAGPSICRYLSHKKSFRSLLWWRFQYDHHSHRWKISQITVVCDNVVNWMWNWFYRSNDRFQVIFCEIEYSWACSTFIIAKVVIIHLSFYLVYYLSDFFKVPFVLVTSFPAGNRENFITQWFRIYQS